MTKQPSQTSMYGELLVDDAQYRRDVSHLQKRDPHHDQQLLERARNGDEQAKEEILLACYSYSEAVARKYARVYSWASARLEYVDLMQVGILRALECFDKALHHPHPFGYLWKAIHGTIVTHCLKWCSPIAAVQNHEGRWLPALPVMSLDAPLQENPDEIVANVIEDTTMQLQAERDHTVLYEALETLVPRQQDAVTRYYGIECASESYETIGLTWGIADRRKASSYASVYERRGVQALKKRLETIPA
jgi:RNA polymerase sigma factor (sigma-70 family)